MLKPTKVLCALAIAHAAYLPASPDSLIKAALPVHCAIAVAAGRTAYVLQMIPGMRRCGAMRMHVRVRLRKATGKSCARRLLRAKHDDLFIDCQSLNEIFSTYSALNIR
ncbi:hypothetical protein FHY35_002444 [Xanthomonas arboricola]|uniref:hypothetical protein n=1 Tax=Xanthomonas arboricola TaxID=56448 RepID=UPI00141BB08C|nr:hypothetical protein [Xanthomonas arboricola]NIJ85420.1 hypothetical protein [Xanthomonas arboricola]